MSQNPSPRDEASVIRSQAHAGSSVADTHSLSSCASLPDFSAQHHQYTRGLLKGRHPRSFPKQSELWYHYKSSAARLDRVTKGHNLWNVVEEQEEKLEQIPSPCSEHGENQAFNRSGTFASVADKGNSRYIPKSTLHGMYVDTKSVMRMHYGMNIVLMNCSDEVLCVNQYDEVLCKTEAMLEDGDEICFKVIDLTEPTNPGAIEYGKPIWLQTLRSNSDNNIYFGFVLTSKLFGPPEMQSTQLSQMKGLKKASKMISGNANKNRQTFKGESSTNLTRPASRDKESTPLDPDADSLSGRKSYKEGEKNNNKNISKKSSEMSEVCGGISVLRAFNNKGDVTLVDTDMTRFRSRQASHLGSWTVQNALKTGVPSKFVQSCTDIYLSQDLYCLATSHGNIYDPWPRTVEVNKVQAQLEKKKEVQKCSKLAESGFFSQSRAEKKAASSSEAGGGDGSLLTPKARVIPTFTSNIPHGCLRRVVERGAPYSHVVDRRCVWKFCVTDNPRDLKLLSVKEQKAHKLLRKAKAGLNKSKQNRLGGRVHEGYDVNGKPLIGGEKFPRLLRSIVSQESLKLETLDMMERRHKEEAISHHLRSMYEGSPSKSISGSRSGDDHSTGERVISSDEVFKKPRAALKRLREKMKGTAIPKYDVGEHYAYTFGHEMLQIHQGFASVNNRVTGNIIKTSMRNALNNDEDMRRRRALANASDSLPSDSAEDALEMMKLQRGSDKADPEALDRRLSLLTQADTNVMLALQYQSRINNKVNIGNLFEDVLDDDNEGDTR